MQFQGLRISVPHCQSCRLQLPDREYEMVPLFISFMNQEWQGNQIHILISVVISFFFFQNKFSCKKKVTNATEIHNHAFLIVTQESCCRPHHLKSTNPKSTTLCCPVIDHDERLRLSPLFLSKLYFPVLCF